MTWVRLVTVIEVIELHSVAAKKGWGRGRSRDKGNQKRH